MMRFLGAVLLAAATLLSPVRAENVFIPATGRPRVVVAGNTAYSLDDPRQILPASVGAVSVSPDGRYVLATAYDVSPRNFIAEVTGRDGTVSALHGALTLFLFDTLSGTTTTLKRWEGKTATEQSIDRMTWLPDKRTVVVPLITSRVASDDRVLKSTVTLLVVRVDNRTVRSVPLASSDPETNNAFVQAGVSRRGEAWLSYYEMGKGRMRRFDVNTGTLGASLGKPGDALGVIGFAGEDEVLFSISRENGTAGRGVWNRKTGAYRETLAPTTKAQFEAEKRRYPYAREYAYTPPKSFPLRMQEGDADVQTGDGAVKTPVSTLVAMDKDGLEPVLLVTDAAPVITLGTAAKPILVYSSGDALYAVVARPIPLSEYEKYLRMQAESSVGAIIAAFNDYANYETDLPAPGTDIEAVLARHKVGVAAFRDPRTGASVVTYTYTGVADSVTGHKPLFSYRSRYGAFDAYVDKEGFIQSAPVAPKP